MRPLWRVFQSTALICSVLLVGVFILYSVGTGFLGGSPLLPVYAGEIAGRCLGCKVEAYDENGKSVVGQRGELVITAPMPSMPVGLWGDTDGSR